MANHPKTPFPSSLPSPPTDSTKEINKFFDSNNDKLVDNENSLVIRSNWVSSMIDFVWNKQNTLMARSLVFPVESFRATMFLIMYVDKALALGAIEVIWKLYQSRFLAIWFLSPWVIVICVVIAFYNELYVGFWFSQINKWENYE